MINDEIIISDFPDKRIKIKCESCIRRGLFQKRDLMVKFGSVASMKNIIAELMQCPHMGDSPHLCGAKFELTYRKKRSSSDL